MVHMKKNFLVLFLVIQTVQITAGRLKGVCGLVLVAYKNSCCPVS